MGNSILTDKWKLYKKASIKNEKHSEEMKNALDELINRWNNWAIRELKGLSIKFPNYQEWTIK